MIRIALKSNQKFIEFVLFCLSFLNNNQFHLSEEDYFRMELSTREALNNAIAHGNKNIFDKEVTVELTWNNHELNIEIKDQCEEEIDFCQIETDNKKKDLLSCNGRGIMIMRSYMDYLNFSSSGIGNTVIMKKKLQA